MRHFISTFPAELFVVTADPDAVPCVVVDLVNSVAFVDVVAAAEDA